MILSLAIIKTTMVACPQGLKKANTVTQIIRLNITVYLCYPGSGHVGSGCMLFICIKSVLSAYAVWEGDYFLLSNYGVQEVAGLSLQ